MTAAILLLVALIAAPLLAPNWRVLGGVTLGLMTVLSLIWLKLGAGDVAPAALAQAFLGLALVGVLGATLGRVIGLRLQAGGRPRWSVLWADALGLGLAACIVALPYLYDMRIVNKPPAAACLARPLPVQIGTARLALPFMPAIGLITGPSIRRDDRALGFVPHQRDLCERSENGALPVQATALIVDGRTDFCKTPTAGWQVEHCTSPKDFPRLTILYAPGAIDVAEFGIGQARTGAQPVTDGTQNARCVTTGDIAACDAELEGPEGLSLYLEFLATSGQEAATLSRVAANAARILDELTAP